MKHGRTSTLVSEAKVPSWAGWDIWSVFMCMFATALLSAFCMENREKTCDIPDGSIFCALSVSAERKIVWVVKRNVLLLFGVRRGAQVDC